jgi:hypothetical protein
MPHFECGAFDRFATSLSDSSVAVGHYLRLGERCGHPFAFAVRDDDARCLGGAAV